MVTYTDRERKALLNFVTSVEDPIYAVINVPPVVFGSFGSFFSRNPKSMRDHLLDAIYGRIKGFEIEGGEENLRRLASSELEYLQNLNKVLNKIISQQGDIDESEFNKLAITHPYKAPHEAIKSGLAKAESFFEMWYGRYSHKSIANTVWLQFAGENVTQLFARELAYDQLAFFIEQSTRYTKFSTGDCFLDPDIEKAGLKNEYTKAIDALINSYEALTQEGQRAFQRDIPFERWLEMRQQMQTESEKAQQAAYKREIDGKVFDIARYALPQAVRTNIAWALDARSTEFDIAAWKNHPLREIQDDAHLIEKHGGMVASSILKYTEPNPHYADSLHEYNGDLNLNLKAKKLTKGARILNPEAITLDMVVTLLYQRCNPASYNEVLNQVKTMTFEDKIKVLERVSRTRAERDEWIEIEEVLDLPKVLVEIDTDVGAIRDIRRHQKPDRSESRYSLKRGHSEPKKLEEYDLKIVQQFREAIEIAFEAEQAIIKAGLPFQAQYTLPMATNHSIITSVGIDQLQYTIATRTPTQGHFSYREDFQNVAHAAVRAWPWILGYPKYPEGKSFAQVLNEAPLKNVLKVNLEETGLHT